MHGCHLQQTLSRLQFDSVCDMVGLIQTTIMSHTNNGTQAGRAQTSEMIATISCSKTYTRTHVVYCVKV